MNTVDYEVLNRAVFHHFCGQYVFVWVRQEAGQEPLNSSERRSPETSFRSR